MDLTDGLINKTTVADRIETSVQIEPVIDILEGFTQTVEHLEDLTGRLTFMLREIQPSVETKE